MCDAVRGARQSNAQYAIAVRRGRDRQRLSQERPGHIRGGMGRAFACQRHGGFRDRAYPQADVEQESEGAEGAGHEPRDVVAGDVFQHLSAERKPLPHAVDDGDPEQGIAHGAEPGPSRPRQSGGHGAAKCASTAEKRGLEGQCLAGVLQNRRNVVQLRSRPGGNHEFVRMIVDDAFVARCRDPLRFPGWPGLAAGTHDGDGTSAVSGSGHRRGEGFCSVACALGRH